MSDDRIEIMPEGFDPVLHYDEEIQAAFTNWHKYQAGEWTGDLRKSLPVWFAAIGWAWKKQWVWKNRDEVQSEIKSSAHKVIGNWRLLEMAPKLSVKAKTDYQESVRAAINELERALEK